MRNLHKQMSWSFLDHYVLFQLAQLLSVGIVDVVFQSAGTGKYARPTRHFKFHFILLTVSYELLVKSRFLLIRFVLHQIHSSYLLTNSMSSESVLYAAFSRIADVLPYMVHVTPPQTL